MGLPLYIPPVESDLRNKDSTSRPSPTHGPNRIRRARRSTEALVESRRRAILTATAAVSQPEMTDRQREIFRERQQQLDDMQREMVERHELQHGSIPRNWPRARLVRTRELMTGPVSSVSNPSPQEPNPGPISHPSRERLLQRFLERIRDHEQARTLANRIREEATADVNRSNADGTNSANAATSTSNTNNAAIRASNGAGSNTNSSINNVNNANGVRDEHRLWYEYFVSRSRGQAAAADGRNRSGYRAPTPSNEDAGAAMTAAIIDNLEGNGGAFDHNLLAALDRGWSGPTTSQPNRTPQQQRSHMTMEQFLVPGNTERDADAEASRVASSRRAYRRASSLRRVTNASASSRRPTVGWSDNNDGAASRSRDSSQSRIFGDTSQIPNGGVSTPATNSRATPDATTARRHAWTVGYLDINGNRRLPRPEEQRRQESPLLDEFGIRIDEHGNRLEDGWGIPADPIDGLGDRRRSLSPEGDGVWDTLLTTLTPDPQPPSVGSSFASSASALAAATAQGQAAWSSSQPTVTQTPMVTTLPAVPSPVTRGQDDDDNGTNESTPAPILVEAAHSPAWFTTESTALTDSVPSGTTSAGTSQRIRSPFTVVSADADTADESAVMFSGLDEEVGDDVACEDSEMDDGSRRDGEEEDVYDEEEEQEEEEARAYFLGMSDEPPTLNSNRRPHQRQDQEAAGQMARMFHFENRDRPLRTGFGGANPERNQRGSHDPNGSGRGSSSNNNNNTTEETLDLLGIGGMQHIVRSLARREDIPDEWWAEAGLSRTLPREASN